MKLVGTILGSVNLDKLFYSNHNLKNYVLKRYEENFLLALYSVEFQLIIWDHCVCPGFDSKASFTDTNCRSVNHLLGNVGCAMNTNYMASMTRAVMALPRVSIMESTWTRKRHISLCSLQNWYLIRKTIFLVPLEYWPL